MKTVENLNVTGHRRNALRRVSPSPFDRGAVGINYIGNLSDRVQLLHLHQLLCDLLRWSAVTTARYKPRYICTGTYDRLVWTALGPLTVATANKTRSVRVVPAGDNVRVFK